MSIGATVDRPRTEPPKTFADLSPQALTSITSLCGVEEFRRLSLVNKAFKEEIGEVTDAIAFLRSLKSVKALTTEQLFQYYHFLRNTFQEEKLSFLDFLKNFEFLRTFVLDEEEFRKQISDHRLSILEEGKNLDTDLLPTLLSHLPASVKELQVRPLKDTPVVIPSRLSLRELRVFIESAHNHLSIEDTSSLEILRISGGGWGPTVEDRFALLPFPVDLALLGKCSKLKILDCLEYPLEIHTVHGLLEHCPPSLEQLGIRFHQLFSILRHEVAPVLLIEIPEHLPGLKTLEIASNFDMPSLAYFSFGTKAQAQLQNLHFLLSNPEKPSALFCDPKEKEDPSFESFLLKINSFTSLKEFVFYNKYLMKQEKTKLEKMGKEKGFLVYHDENIADWKNEEYKRHYESLRWLYPITVARKEEYSFAIEKPTYNTRYDKRIFPRKKIEKVASSHRSDNFRYEYYFWHNYKPIAEKDIPKDRELIPRNGRVIPLPRMPTARPLEEGTQEERDESFRKWVLLYIFPFARHMIRRDMERFNLEQVLIQGIFSSTLQAMREIPLQDVRIDEIKRKLYIVSYFVRNLGASGLNFAEVKMSLVNRILLFIPAIFMLIAGIFSSYYRERAMQIFRGKEVIVCAKI